MPFNNLELLAPVGKMEVLASAVEAGADAVYLGGKRFNMRMLKGEYNFSDDELRFAADYLHQRGKKLYITVNSLYNNEEIEQIGEYLLFLSKLEVDALIIQDLGMVDLCKELGINIPIHASVQMGIANMEAVKLLEDLDIRRVILSKNLSLTDIQAIADNTNLGIEYFIHGDLCVSHTGLCHMSSFLSGAGGNRGRCIKPCRWEYQLNGDRDKEYDENKYYLAHKDLCLYPHLRELIDVGVSSFKIEGRMRNAEYVSYLVSQYRQALDAISADPDNYQMDESVYQELYAKRIRDYSQGSILRRDNRDDIGLDGKREPPFPTAVVALKPLDESNYQGKLPVDKVPELTVKVGSLEGLQRINKYNVKNIILGIDLFRHNNFNWTMKELADLVSMGLNTNSRVMIETSRIVTQSALDRIYKLCELIKDSWINGVVVNDLGSMRIFSDTNLDIWGGYGLNIYNCSSMSLMNKLGLKRITASLELDHVDLKPLLGCGLETEVMIHGPLCGMITDYCIPRSVHINTDTECPKYCVSDEYSLQDCLGQKYRILTDDDCRNHIFYPYELCMFPNLQEVISWGPTSVRIDGQHYSDVILDKVVSIYSCALEHLKSGEWDEQTNYSKLLKIFPAGLSAAPLIRSNT